MPAPDLPADADDKDPQFAYTLARELQVLRAFEGHTTGLGNRDIVGIIGIPRSTVARLTRTLGMLGYLHYDAQTTRYSLTAAMLTLAYPVLAQLPVRQVARPHMQELANDAAGSVSLAGFDVQPGLSACTGGQVCGGRGSPGPRAPCQQHATGSRRTSCSLGVGCQGVCVGRRAAIGRASRTTSRCHRHDRRLRGGSLLQTPGGHCQPVWRRRLAPAAHPRTRRRSTPCRMTLWC